jgi:hypothetical protein
VKHSSDTLLQSNITIVLPTVQCNFCNTTLEELFEGLIMKNDKETIYDLVIVDPDGPDLGVKIRQAQIIVVRVFVGLNDFERSAEDTAEDEFRFVPLAGFEHHVQKSGLLLLVQPERVAVNLPACRPGFIFRSCHIFKL